MRIAALYDVHGNLPALEAVLADVRREGVDAIVAGGDVLYGPWQQECVERLHDVGALFVRGNCEREVLTAGTERALWCLSRLGDLDLEEIAAWPLTRELQVEGLGRIVFCHATPTSDDAMVTRVTPDDAVAAALSGVEADVVVCGHTHVQFDRRLPSGLRVVNAGSVGVAYEHVPGAYWALVGPDVALHRTDYDTEEIAEQVVASGFPGADEWFGAALRGETSPEEATAEFEGRRGG
jgi:putative phosphoesterase